MTPNQRSYELLKWQALAPLAEYDESFDYFSIWKQSSDKALGQWEKDHPKPPSQELAAFRELQRLKAIPKDEFYSPTKAYPPAKHQEHDPERWPSNFYSGRLKEHQAGASDISLRASSSRGNVDQDRAGARLASLDEEPSLPAKNRRRRKRC